ncbi:hypothetical protein ACLVWU_00585 [Bdellovibrio sp. HCB290]|uniref:hypothetical protein n=1 Tax=Bdellovibrio sp. HCB290 TaxID=3394356 RepID=UPI0039B6468E
MKALKLMIAFAIATTASVSFAEPACNGQSPVRNLAPKAAVQRVAASKSVTPPAKAKAAKGINDRS